MARKKPEKIPERGLFTFAEAQEFLRVSHQTLYNLLKEGLPSYKISTKRMFLKEDLLDWIKNHQVSGMIKKDLDRIEKAIKRDSDGKA